AKARRPSSERNGRSAAAPATLSTLRRLTGSLLMLRLLSLDVRGSSRLGVGRGSAALGGRVEGQGQQDRGEERRSRDRQEQNAEVHRAVPLEDVGAEVRPQDVRREGTEAQDQEVEQALRRGARVLREELVHEDVDGREEEGVRDPVQQVDRDYE